MKKRFLFAIAGLLSLVSFAQIPQGYYSAAEGLTGEQLKAALHDIIDGHTVFSYSQCYDILIDTDADPNVSENVIGIYSQFSMDGPAQFAGGAGWNREHVWPQSRGTGRGDAYSDLHHLRVEDASTNSARGNFVFDYAPNDYVDGSGNYNGATPADNGNSLWEPGDGQKGDIARMLFYMATRYESADGVDLELADGNSSLQGNLMGNLETLLDWHTLDPVDQFERNRHERIYSYQNNRNPYIDHPEWVNAIWGDDNEDTPMITLSSTAALNFGAVSAGQSSSPLSYTVSGSNLAGNISISVSNPFELSVNSSTWSSSIIIPQATAEASDVTVFVRFSPQIANGQSYSELISHTSSGAATISRTVFGSEGAEVSPAAWINEMHYSNMGADRDEFVEIYIENPQSYSLADFQVQLIRGSDQEVYGSFNLTTASLNSIVNNAGYYARSFGGILNGPDAIRLLYMDREVDFISYGGPVGSAYQLPLSESETTIAGTSLALCCNSTVYEEMSWVVGNATPGAPNEVLVLSANEQEILVYPNPTRGDIQIKGFDTAQLSVKVLDMRGKELLSYSSQLEKVEIRLGAYLKKLMSGLYILELTDNSQTKQIKLRVAR